MAPGSTIVSNKQLAGARANPRSASALFALLLQRAAAPANMDFLSKYVAPVVNAIIGGEGTSTFAKVTRGVVFFVFCLNVRSWPFVWHVRIWRWAILKRIEYRLFRIRTLLYAPATRGKMEDKWVERSIPLGVHPFEMVSTYKTWASLDESDFNMHLSNSSYAKTMDSARFKYAMEIFTPFFRGGGWMPLAATQYHFICEIPIGASYEVRCRTGAWDNKWFYVVSKFVVPANKSKKKRKAKPAAIANGSNGVTSPNTMPSLRTPSCADEVGSEVPSGSATPANGNGTATSTNSLTAQLLKAGITIESDSGSSTPFLRKLADEDEFDLEEPDGAQVHTVAVSRCCCKVGRITVPPALAFAMCGLTSEPLTKEGLPQHWKKLLETFGPQPAANGKKAKPPMYGTYDPKRMNAFMKGGWREIEKEEDKWWERTFDSIREENAARVARLHNRA